MKNKKNIKSTKKEFVVLLISGIAFLAIGLVFLFVMYRPFVPWVELHFEKDLWKESEVGTYYLDWVGDDLTKSKAHYFYEMEGVKYEKTYPLSISTHAKGCGKDYSVIYVNTNNPLETKPGSQGGGGLLFFIIIFSIAGIFMIFQAFFNNRNSAKGKRVRVK